MHNIAHCVYVCAKIWLQRNIEIQPYRTGATVMSEFFEIWMCISLVSSWKWETWACSCEPRNLEKNNFPFHFIKKVFIQFSIFKLPDNSGSDVYQSFVSSGMPLKSTEISNGTRRHSKLEFSMIRNLTGEPRYLGARCWFHIRLDHGSRNQRCFNSPIKSAANALLAMHIHLGNQFKTQF